MITNNFKKVLGLMLECHATQTTGIVSVKNLAGETKYASTPWATQSFPNSVSKGLSLNNVTGGLLIGSGATAPTANDYNLSNRITSGVSTVSPTTQYGVDENGNPYLIIIWVLTNNTASDITISEVGYAQYLKGSSTLNGNANDTVVMLFDRTLLDEALVLPANGAGVLKYTLKTIIS